MLSPRDLLVFYHCLEKITLKHWAHWAIDRLSVLAPYSHLAVLFLLSFLCFIRDRVLCSLDGRGYTVKPKEPLAFPADDGIWYGFTGSVIRTCHLRMYPPSDLKALLRYPISCYTVPYSRDRSSLSIKLRAERESTYSLVPLDSNR